MIRFLTFGCAILIVGCAAPYKGPESGPVATIHFQLQEGRADGPTVSMFEGVECKPSEYGEYIGTLWDGNLTEPSTLEFTVKVPADRELAFELFNRTKFTGELVRPGQFCRHTFAFSPKNGGHYTVTYGNCEYHAIETSSGKELDTKSTTGECHSSKYIGAY